MEEIVRKTSNKDKRDSSLSGFLSGSIARYREVASEEDEFTFWI